MQSRLPRTFLNGIVGLFKLRTGENVRLYVSAKLYRHFLWRAHTQSGLLRRMLRSHHGVAVPKSLNGHILLVTEDANGTLVIKDERGGSARITTSDAYQSNGILHVVDSVLRPR
jgi:hypothetical protein